MWKSQQLKETSEMCV